MSCMDRRRFLLSVAGLFGTGAITPVLRAASGPSPSDKENDFSVDFTRPGRPIADDFLGLSFDQVGLLLDQILLPNNHSFISLVRHLGSKGVIRIGGNSSDRPSLRLGKTLKRTHIEHLAAFLSATGWRLIYGLDLGSGKPEDAAAEAEMVAQIVGPKLLAFQIGNEPDDFRQDIRKATYNHPDYIAEWRVFSAAIRARVPGAPLAGPDVAFDSSWLVPFAQTFGREVIFLTCHYYSEGPASSSSVTTERMLGSGKTLAGVINSVARATAESGLQVRMAESNSVFGGGKTGISDTLAAAVWGVDVMFTLAEAGWIGINFHGGGGYYSPIAQTSSGTFEPKPLYYAMRLFAEAGRGSILPVIGHGSLQPGAAQSRLRVFAVLGTSGERRIILVNTDTTQSERVRIATKGREATIMWLTAHSPDSQSGLTFGGAGIGPTGDWTPRKAQLVTRSSDRFVVDMPAVSAAVLQIHG